MTTIEKEKRVVFLMIRLYCRKQHHTSDLCGKCRELENYSFTRIDKCPHLPDKPKCSKCQTHCFRNNKREEIRRVMRYSGPRMIIYHPVIALQHMLR
ncbi:MAG: nitrous oxide-stimulated promoter family protein [Bacteroidales bacterium]|nr:nitrous oxide-stimulated promoter family protein [Bacteroidales bacterium]MDD4214618.1 nitrous oxide-stimulated promoter family protein [Bacteroidales bacterium]